MFYMNLILLEKILVLNSNPGTGIIGYMSLISLTQSKRTVTWVLLLNALLETVE